jgi:apolipoprotein N-acyltransferase
MAGWRGSLVLSVALGASASLFWLAQPPHDHWWLGPLALVPWLRALPVGRAHTCALSGLAFGTLGGAFVAGWLVSGLVELGAGETASLLSLLAVPLVVAGLPWGIFAVSLALIARWRPQDFALFAGLTLGAVDLARSYLGVPWALLGHSQWTSPGTAQLAVLGGVPLVSVLLAWCSGSLVMLWRKPDSPRHRWETAAALVACICLWLLGVPLAQALRPERFGPAYELLLVQPNVPARERWSPQLQASNLGIVTRLTTEARREAGRQPDLVVWPESTLTQPIERDGKVRQALATWSQAAEIPLVTGLARASHSGRVDRYRNAAVWWSPEGEIVASIDKTVAVPLIEAERGLWLPDPVWSWLGVPRDGVLTEAGSSEEPLRGPIETTVLLCYEAIFPGLAADRRSPRTVAILNLANDSWFGTGAVSRQQIAYGTFRAIEQRLPFLRVAHGGESIVIDSLGRAVASLPHGTSGALWTTVRREPPPSLKERFVIGGLAAVPATLILAIGGVIRRRRA